MRFPKNCAIEKCVSPESRAYGTTYVAFDADAQSLVATDGCGMVVLPVDAGASDVDGLIPPEAINAARKAAVGRNGDAILAVNGDVKLQDGRTWPKGAATFPDWRSVQPKEAPVFKVTLNVTLLARLCAALGVHCATLEVGAPGAPIHVIPVAVNGERAMPGSRALLMPMG